MERKRVFAGLILAVLGVSGAWAADEPAARVLEAGTYTAQVTAIPCSACPPGIEKTLKAQPAIEEVSVDQDASTVKFSVKPGTQLPLSELQKALKAASDQMGMGADYQLKNVKKAD